MGGHGGLNILPQKRWNVYNYENREKVRRDEEAAAREEQLKREQVRKRDAEFRLERLRAARGLAPLNKPAEPAEEDVPEAVEAEPKSGHINLFEGIKIFDPIKVLENGADVEKEGSKRKKMKKEEAAPRVVGPEEEKYRLGYGVAGKGVKLPWYLEKRNDDNLEEERGEYDGSLKGTKQETTKIGKKTIEELREERLKREKREKERERAFLEERRHKNGVARKNRGFTRR